MSAESDLLGDPVVAEDRVRDVGRAGEERVRADEGLADAAVDLDPEPGDLNPRLGAFERFLLTGMTLMIPGFSATASDPLIGVRSVGMGVSAPVCRPAKPRPGDRPRLPLITTPLDVLMSMPQPI